MTVPTIDTHASADFTEWLSDNPAADDETKLAALRAYIYDTAVHGVQMGNFTPDWANKKLRKLGIARQITSTNVYALKAMVSAEVTLTIHASDRADALREFKDRLVGRLTVFTPDTSGEPQFVSGPEDTDDVPLPDDAPTTTEETLTVLREVIMLAVIAGPHFCEDGANDALEEFGLAHIPARQKFTITRPADAELMTTVEAYDEASARRVADWRWEDGRQSYIVKAATATAEPVVEAPQQ